MDAATELPDDVAELIQQHEEEKILRIEAFSQMVAKKRDEAVIGRANSGVETTWEEDEEHYLGIDAANRGSVAQARKPASPNAGFAPTKIRNDSRSTVFLNITRPYVDAIVARTCDILLPTDDKNWGIQPTPIPDLIRKMGVPNPGPIGPAMGNAPQGMPGALPQMPGAQAAQANQPGMPPQTAMPPAPIDPLQQMIDQAKDAATKAERRIDDWLSENGYNAENRKVIFDSAKLGTGILKGPFPERRKSTSVSRGPNGMAVQMSLELKPASKRVDPWNFYPDPSCGESIHDGNYCFEKDYLTAKSLRELSGNPGYIGTQIEAVLEEGPKGKEHDSFSGNPNRNRLSDKDLFEVWYSYMAVEMKDLEAAGVDVTGLKAGSIHAIVTMVNSRIIKAVVNPLDSGEYPYDVMPWQRVSGQWHGIGVSRQIRACQQQLNAANRNMMDNAGLSGGPILIVRQNCIIPADGDWTLRPRKIFYTTAEADVRSVQDAIFAVNIPNMQAELMNIIQFSLKTAELVTGFPLLMQGQANPGSSPDTYGGQILATNNASTVLRYIARTYDDCVTTRHIKRYYEYLMEYGEHEDEKGDFTIVARGAAVLVEREIQAQEMMQLIQMSGNAAFGLDPKKLIAEYFKSRRFDPRKFQYSDEEMAKLQQQPSQPAPAVQAAQIRAESAKEVATIKVQGEVAAITTEANLEIQAQQQGHLSPQAAAATARIEEAKIRAASEQEKERSRSQTELAYVTTEQKIAADNANARIAEMNLKRDLLLLEYSLKHEMQLNDVKAALAKSAMDNQTQRQLAELSAQVKTQTAAEQRQHDGQKHVMNVQSNIQTAAAAREHSSEQQALQHEHEMELAQKTLDAAKEKMQEVPGKRQ